MLLTRIICEMVFGQLVSMMMHGETMSLNLDMFHRWSTIRVTNRNWVLLDLVIWTNCRMTKIDGTIVLRGMAF